jgi:hypothetical protein
MRMTNECVQSNYSPTPVGQALALLGRYLREGTLLQTPSTQFVRMWAVVSPAGDSLHVILLNKGLSATTQSVAISNAPANAVRVASAHPTEQTHCSNRILLYIYSIYHSTWPGQIAEPQGDIAANEVECRWDCMASYFQVCGHLLIRRRMPCSAV